ncbi:MAG: thioredoxin family protein [Desulfobacterales bacterium]
MKHARLIALILITLLVLATGAPLATAAKIENIRWFSYEEGFEKAKKEGKKIYILFFSDYCKYCKEMDATTFSDREVVEMLNEEFVAIRVNPDKEYKIAYKYNIRPVPDNWFLDEKGGRVFRELGFMDANRLESVLNQVQNGKKHLKASVTSAKH